MKVHEYQAKEIFSTYGIPVERHALCHTADGAVAAYHRMGVNRVASADRRAGKSRRSKVGQ
jgi:succinyl-CoA synthetase beta subunit